MWCGYIFYIYLPGLGKFQEAGVIQCNTNHRNHIKLAKDPPQKSHLSQLQRALYFTNLYTYYIPIQSMYGIFTYIWLICMVNVGKYTIHGCYGIHIIHLWGEHVPERSLMTTTLGIPILPSEERWYTGWFDVKPWATTLNGETNPTNTSWWFFATHFKNMQPSNWIISPGIGVKIPKMFELPPPRISYLLSYGFVRNLFLVWVGDVCPFKRFAPLILLLTFFVVWSI